MTQVKDYYSILGVQENASKEEIKKRYRDLAKKHHPDLFPDNPENEDYFKRITEAYNVLSNEDGRKKYDLNRMGADNFSTFDLSSIFSYQNFRRNNLPRKGADHLINVELSYFELVFGVEKEISFSFIDLCVSCKGTGAHSLATCSVCKGSGLKKMQQGRMQFTLPCTSCNNSGSVISEKCKNELCDNGKYKHDRKVVVKFPKNLSLFSRIKLTGIGGPAIGNAPEGDVYIQPMLHIQKDSLFSEEEKEQLKGLCEKL